MTPRLLITLTGLVTFAAATAVAVSPFSLRFDETLAFAEDQSETLALNILDYDREDFVDYTNTLGDWNIKSDSTWTSGFLPGIYWYLYAFTGEDQWRQYAEHWTEGVRSRATATDNDTGFQIFESFGMGYEFVEGLRDDYLPVLLQGAETLVTERYNEDIGAFRSWDQGISNPTSLPFEVNIDQMMNLELILWASQNGGPAEYEDYAISHADKSWEHNVREDGGTYHVVAYNLDGTVDYTRTHQGWREESTWSRGHAWAVYGYTMVYRYTGLPRMLERARKLYDYFITETLEDASDYIPYSDFDAPLDSRNPRDTSAAAIVASAALELYQITEEQQFLDDAEAILSSLTSDEYMAWGTRFESILRKASVKWGTAEVGAIFADFYLLEAMWRWDQLDLNGDQITGSWIVWDVYDHRYADTGDWMGWIDVANAPYVYSFGLGNWLYTTEAYHDENGSGWIYVFDTADLITR